MWLLSNSWKFLRQILYTYSAGQGQGRNKDTFEAYYLKKSSR